EAMTRAIFLMFFVLFAPSAGQSQPVPGLIAEREAAGLSHADRLAAYDAEQAVLARNEIVLGYNWRGPDGAYGTIIVGSFLPTGRGYSQCRRFIHIVHHRN